MKATVPNDTMNTPEHCHACHNFKHCNQAQNMHEFIEPVKGYISFTGPEGDKIGTYVCDDCLDEKDTDLYDMEYECTDSPCHCEECGVPLIHDLTTDGTEYVNEILRDNNAGCCRELWLRVWADYLDSDVLEPEFHEGKSEGRNEVIEDIQPLIDILLALDLDCYHPVYRELHRFNTKYSYFLQGVIS